ncbi:MAG: hypothetical protein K2P78_05015 [Gemmataceae bacterium]|nr:hypothetical protein [Gemmataceae bacterium]
MPAPKPDRVAGILDGPPPGVPDPAALGLEERVLAGGGEQDEEPSVLPSWSTSPSRRRQ